MRTRAGLIAATLSVGVATVIQTPGVAAAATQSEVVTNFALAGNGWSTRLDGGDVPVQSGRTGYQVVGCTRLAGVERTNHTAAVDLPSDSPVVHVGATETRVWTAKASGTVSSNTLNTVANVLIGDISQQALLIEGIRTRTRAWHDASGYHRSARVTVADVTRYDAGVATGLVSIPPDQDLNGESLEIPGLVRATFGIKEGNQTRRGAKARAIGIKLELLPSSSTLRVGQASSAIQGGAVAGIMGGTAYGSEMVGLDGTVSSGRGAVVFLPCQGTNGRWLSNSVATEELPGVAQLEEVVSRVMGDQENGSAYNRGTADVARVVFSEQNLKINAIHGEALVRLRRDGSYLRSSRGTTIGGITHDGTKYSAPRPGRTLTIPDVARITVAAVAKKPTAIKVSAVKVELLQGTQAGTTVSLGNVSLKVKRR